jgi:hypothetical protein
MIDFVAGTTVRDNVSVIRESVDRVCASALFIHDLLLCANNNSVFLLVVLWFIGEAICSHSAALSLQDSPLYGELGLC